MKRRFLPVAHLCDIPVGATQLRIDHIRAGVSPLFVDYLSDRLGLSKGRLCADLGIPLSTLRRKMRDGGKLSPAQSERLLGVQRLIQEAARIVQQSGGPQDFNAAAWVAGFLDMGMPAIGGLRPADYMDTVEGQAFVVNLIHRAQAGVYC